MPLKAFNKDNVPFSNIVQLKIGDTTVDTLIKLVIAINAVYQETGWNYNRFSVQLLFQTATATLGSHTG